MGCSVGICFAMGFSTGCRGICSSNTSSPSFLSHLGVCRAVSHAFVITPLSLFCPFLDILSQRYQQLLFAGMQSSTSEGPPCLTSFRSGQWPIFKQSSRPPHYSYRENAPESYSTKKSTLPISGLGRLLGSLYPFDLCHTLKIAHFPS